MFVDLAGFTALTERLEAEQVRDLLTQYCESTCKPLITRYGGVVERFVGGPVIAFWGASSTREDDAERAVRTAFDLVAAVPALGRDKGVDLDVRVGVSTGEAMVTMHAPDQGTVAGDLVNTTSRIQAAAAPGSVYVSDATKRATEAAIVYEDVGPRHLRGGAEPVRLWRAVRVIGLVKGALRSSGLESPFVGRDALLRLVKERFHASSEERKACLISVTGERGMGKSRLDWEFRKYLDGLVDPPLWHRGRCLPSASDGNGVTCSALAQIVKWRARIAKAEDRTQALEKLEAMTRRYVPDKEECERVLPRLSHLVGLEDWGATTSENLFWAWQRFFEGMAEQFPTVLIFEDFQWADSATVAFVDHLVERSRNHRLFVLTLARPELHDRHPTWGTGRPSYVQRRLDPLPLGAMEKLLEGLVPDLPGALQSSIVQRSGGTPLYAVETVRLLVDRGSLAQEGSVYRPVGDIGPVELPDTLEALVSLRLDHLPPQERLLLQDASALGKNFPIAALAAIGGRSEAELEPLLRSLVDKEILRNQPDLRSPEHNQHGFLQEVVRQAVYDRLSDGDRRERHLAAASHLEGFLDREDEAVEVTASHYLLAYQTAPHAADIRHLRAKARQMLVRAGNRAASLSATREAQDYFDQAAGLADDAFTEGGILEQAGLMALRGDRAQQAEDRFRRAVALFESVEEGHSAARLSNRLAEAVKILRERDVDRPDGVEEDLDAVLARSASDSSRLQWIADIWAVLAARNSFDFGVVGEPGGQAPSQPPDPDEEPASEAVATAAAPQGASGSRRQPLATSQHLGDQLEQGFLAILRQLFVISERTYGLIVDRLRRQHAGQQYGHDLEFDCTARTGESIRCHVECKHYARPIRSAEVADKLLQEEHFWAENAIDHWILISPRTGPSNELSAMLQRWEDELRWPFRVQIWSPEVNVQELFALEPSVYAEIYGEPPETDGVLEQDAIVERWLSRLQGVLRLPRAWREYVTSSDGLLCRGDPADHFRALFGDFVPLQAVESKDRLQPDLLESICSRWLAEEDSRSLLILGEFGEGKSFFTYALARRLAKDFVANPSRGWIPLRIPLRTLRLLEERDPRQLLARRLDEMRTSVGEWMQVTERYRTVVMLDGFDELSSKLDSRTVSENIRWIGECVREFPRSKVLITSRKHLFEIKRDRQRFFDQVGGPLVVNMAPVPREQRLDHLEAYARSIEAYEKFLAVRKLYDPIGLARKPLFLQMLKETLDQLPEDRVDEIVLYETYIEKSLRRKIDDLGDPESQLSHEELVANLQDILDQVAVRLHRMGGDFVFLRSLEHAGSSRFAEMLWKMSEDVGMPPVGRAGDEMDVRARVGIRSLLKVVPGPDEEQWPVDFFHRSMREFFIAKALVRRLGTGSAEARELLTIPLSPEITHFAVTLLRRDPPKNAEGSLMSLASSAVVELPDTGALGGNALTLLYGLMGSLPKKDWPRLNLDHAALSGADLRDVNFEGSTLRESNLENVDLTGANLTNADLRGVRLEETAMVDALTFGSDGEEIFVAYEDRALRSWCVGLGGRWHSETLIRKLPFRADLLAMAPGGDMAIVGEGHLTLCGRVDGTWKAQANGQINTAIRSVSVGGTDAALIVEGERGGTNFVVVDCERKSVTAWCEAGGYGVCAKLRNDWFLVPKGDGSTRLVHRVHGEDRVMRSWPDVTRAATWDDGEVLYLAVGHRNGTIGIHEISLLPDGPRIERVWHRAVHRGRITALSFGANRRLASGGADRVVCVINFAPEAVEGEDVDRLHLTVRCNDLRFDGVQGERERALLRRLTGPDAQRREAV